MRRISAASSYRLASEGHECIYVNKNRCNLITRSSQGLFLFFVFFSFNFLWCCWGNGGINSLLRNWNLCLPCFGYQRVQTCNLTISNPNKKKAIRNCWRIPKVGNICRLCWLRSTIALRQNKKKRFWAMTLQFSVTCQQITWRLRSEIKTRERERSQEVKSKKMFESPRKITDLIQNIGISGFYHGKLFSWQLFSFLIYLNRSIVSTRSILNLHFSCMKWNIRSRNAKGEWYYDAWLLYPWAEEIEFSWIAL